VKVLLDENLDHALRKLLGQRHLPIVALSAIQLPIIKTHLPNIIAAIDDVAPVLFKR